MVALLDRLDPAVFGFCCDTGHAAVAGEGPGAYVRALAPRLLGIHYHDNGGEDDHRFPGRGSIDWEDFFAALREVGYTLPITVEALPPENMPLAQAAAILRESAAELRAPKLPEE
jgi:sugar phosphate isomerase/epimerase